VILVAGGTGTLGRQLVRRLAADGANVRVLTRSADRASSLAQIGADVVVGDIRDRIALRAATAGATAVVSAVQGFAGLDPGGPRAVDLWGNADLMQAAHDAGVRRFVLVSASGATADSAMELRRIKHAAEEALAHTPLDWTAVRPTVYLETWLEILGAMADKGAITLFGQGQNPINFVSVVDVAALIDRILTADDTIGEVFEIGGPYNLTLDQLARRVLDARGIRRPSRHLPIPLLRVAARVVRPVKPVVANLAELGVLMDTTDMALHTDTARSRFPDLPHTRLDDVLQRSTHRYTGS
jgi:NADH dehydrogenase